MYIYIDMCVCYSPLKELILEVAIEIFPEWNLNHPRRLNSVQTLLPTEISGHEFNTHSEPTFYNL